MFYVSIDLTDVMVHNVLSPTLKHNVTKAYNVAEVKLSLGARSTLPGTHGFRKLGERQNWSGLGGEEKNFVETYWTNKWIVIL
jgi:hypothetical protein